MAEKTSNNNVLSGIYLKTESSDIEFDEEGNRRVLVGGVYRHFKGGKYIVIVVGQDTDTGKLHVVYRDYRTGEIWIRERSEFLSEVDHVKYPDVEQKYRFRYEGSAFYENDVHGEEIAK